MGSRLVLGEPLLLAAMAPFLLDEAFCGIAAFSFPLALLLLDPRTDVDCGGGGDGGRAYNSVQRFAVRSCCARLRMYSVAMDGTSQHTSSVVIYGYRGSAKPYLMGHLRREHDESMLHGEERDGLTWVGISEK